MRRFAAAMFAVAVTGCATTPPGVAQISGGVYKAGLAPYSDEQARDETACAQSSSGEPAFIACLKARGWTFTTTHWYRAGGTETSFAEDRRQCAVTPVTPVGTELSPAVGAGIAVGRCLQARGWELRPGRP